MAAGRSRAFRTPRPGCRRRRRADRDAMDGMAIPTRFNIARHCLAGPAQRTPEKTALIVVGNLADGIEHAWHWTYAELDLAVRRVAAGLLAEGLAAGDRLL